MVDGAVLCLLEIYSPNLTLVLFLFYSSYIQGYCASSWKDANTVHETVSCHCNGGGALQQNRQVFP